ncbi:EP1-like glycoprotein 1 [Capsicum chacoense]
MFVCGFFCDHDGTACVFGVLIFPSEYDSYLYYPRLVWSPNRDNPVKVNATLQLRQDGGLLLMDSNDTLIWKTNTRGKLVSGFKLTEMGNLVLFCKCNDTIWQSFDHSIDSLVPGKIMSNPRQLYILTLDVGKPFPGLSFLLKSRGPRGMVIINFELLNARFMRFGVAGHLWLYKWTGSWSEEADLLTHSIGECGYPTACGNYSVCVNGQCSCPQTVVVFSLTNDDGALNKTTLFIKAREGVEEAEEYFLDQVPGMPTRFSYEELTVMTENFSKKLGEGGFGSVFEGIMSDGTKLAVKHLQGVSNMKKSFLAEVAAIGSIQHVHLVRLVGFCAEKSHMLLVYEYMASGSLDRWIFHGKHERSHGIIRFWVIKARGKDESKIVTTMRGTAGYLAPEWLNSVITEKVDVYSFGVVILEIICGRKNLDMETILGNGGQEQ